VVIVQLTEQGRVLREQARDIPQCILGASGRSVEQLRQLQEDLQVLRGHLQGSL
jgi:hypothetical protein